MNPDYFGKVFGPVWNTARQCWEWRWHTPGGYY